MSRVIQLTSEDPIAEILDYAQHFEKVIVDFSALAWCVPCRRLKPHYDAASEQLPNVKFLYVDADSYPEALTKLNVMGVPTLFAYKDGEYVGQLQERTVIRLVQEIESL
jgi:thioredoxin 1